MAYHYAYNAQIVWLDPKRRQKPLILLDAIEQGGLFQDSHNYLLVNFPRGWASKANIQHFASGGNNLSSSGVEFDRLDERGFMMISQWQDETGEASGNTTNQDYYWNGENFSAR